MTSAYKHGQDRHPVGQPLYERIADLIRAQIRSGVLPSGHRLKGEQELAAEFEVSRPTIRSALAKLQLEGYLLKRQGLGSFVRPQRVRQVLGRLETLNESMSEQGRSSETKVLSLVFGPGSDTACAALNLPRGSETMLVRRLHVVNGEPIALVFLTVAATFGGRLSRADVDAHTFYELFPSRLGISIGRAEQTLRAAPADADTGAALGVAPGSILLTCERVTFSGEGRPIIHALFNHRADRFEFRISLSPHDRQAVWLPPGLMPLS